MLRIVLFLILLNVSILNTVYGWSVAPSIPKPCDADSRPEFGDLINSSSGILFHGKLTKSIKSSANWYERSSKTSLTFKIKTVIKGYLKKGDEVTLKDSTNYRAERKIIGDEYYFSCLDLKKGSEYIIYTNNTFDIPMNSCSPCPFLEVSDPLVKELFPSLYPQENKIQSISSFHNQDNATMRKQGGMIVSGGLVFILFAYICNTFLRKNNRKQ